VAGFVKAVCNGTICLEQSNTHATLLMPLSGPIIPVLAFHICRVGKKPSVKAASIDTHFYHV